MPLLDRLADRVFRLPAATGPYRVDRGLRIPLRDGVTLSADHYTPAGPAAGTILVRGPYGRHFPYDVLYARPYAARGYHVLFVSVRGTAASGGDFDPMRTEHDDGQDVVAWLIAQPWFTGTFATIGPSYLGFTQWAILADPPAELTRAVVTVGPHDFSRHTWGSGAFALDLVGWSDMIAQQPRSDARPRVLRTMLRRSARERMLRRVRDSLPLADVADRHFNGAAPWFRDRATRPDLADPYWTPMRQTAALDRAGIPILLLSGWQDMFLGQTIEQYTHLRERGVPVALTIGPWAHVDTVGRGSRIGIPETLDWLAGRDRPAPVHLYVTGANEWRHLPSWPPPTVKQPFALTAGGFTFDPADPTPTVGGPLLEGGGYVDDGRLAARADVLTSTGDVLTADLEIAGAPIAELIHRTDNPHADLFVRLSEVDARGRSRNVTEGYVRLDPTREDSSVRLPLLPAAHRFRAGSRIRVLVAGGSHPQYARNLGTGENPGTGTRLVPARHTVAEGSRLLLPVTDPR
jgi:predicted acyl esterase